MKFFPWFGYLNKGFLGQSMTLNEMVFTLFIAKIKLQTDVYIYSTPMGPHQRQIMVWIHNSTDHEEGGLLSLMSVLNRIVMIIA